MWPILLLLNIKEEGVVTNGADVEVRLAPIELRERRSGQVAQKPALPEPVHAQMPPA